MKKPYVLFDFDGTLGETMEEILEGVYHVFRNSLIVPPSINDYVLNFAFPYTGYYHDRGVKADKDQIWKWFREGAGPFKGDFFQDGINLLRRLEEAGYVPAIVSANSKENIQYSLHRHNLNHIEAHSVPSADKTERIRELVESSEFGPETIYVGDIVSDIVQAKAAGARPIAVLRNSFMSLSSHFFEAGATDCIRTLDAIEVP